MNIVLTSTVNEMHKILSRKKLAFIVSISIAVTIGASIINLLTNNSMGVFIFKNPNLPVTVLNFMASFLLPLFVIMLAGDLFSSEFSDNSIVMSLVRPISRNKLYISKILAIGASILAVLMGTFIISFAASLFGGNLHDDFLKMPQNLAAYVATVVPMLLIAIISAFVAQFTKSGSITVVIMILASFLLSALSIFIPQAETFLPTTYLAWYQNFYSGASISPVINELLYLIAYGIMFMSAGTYLFHKKDI